MSNKRTIVREETIREIEGGKWLNQTTGRYHETAILALQAVKSRGKTMAKSQPDAMIIQMIDWITVSRVGRAVVQSIQGQ